MRTILVKTWSALLLVAAFIGLAPLPAAADDAVVARVNGVDIKQSDLDFAASEVGPRLANLAAADRKRVLLQYVIENELMAGAGQKDSLDKADELPEPGEISPAPRAARRVLRRQDHRRGDRGRRQEDL